MFKHGGLELIRQRRSVEKENPEQERAATATTKTTKTTTAAGKRGKRRASEINK